MQTYENVRFIRCSFDMYDSLTEEEVIGTLKVDTDKRYVSFECDEETIILEDISSIGFELVSITVTCDGYEYCFELPNPEHDEEERHLIKSPYQAE